MGANQSTGRPTGPRPIPVRPRTPLQFGSVPTALPVDPARYNKRPIRNLYPSISTQDSVTSLLSQESYLCPPPLSPGSSSDEEDAPSPLSNFGWPVPRLYCPHANCSYSVIGFESTRDLGRHLQTEAHFAPNPMMMEFPQPVQQIPQQPFMAQQQQQCMCADCIYTSEWSASPYQHQAEMEYSCYSPPPPNMHMHMPTSSSPPLHLQMQMPRIVGYNGPEVENLNWSGEQIPKSSMMPMAVGLYPAVKRQRLEFPLSV